jgi:hypothetical protein
MNLNKEDKIILYILDRFNEDDIDYAKDEVVDCLFLFEYYDEDTECIEPFREIGEFGYYLHNGRPYSLDAIETIEELESNNIIKYKLENNKYNINKDVSKILNNIPTHLSTKLNYIINLYINSYNSDFDIVEYSLQVEEDDVLSGTLIDQLIIHSKTPEITTSNITSKLI